MNINNLERRVNQNIPWYLSWGFIIFMFIIFFPIAIYLTVKRININNPEKKAGVALKITGWVFIGLSVFYTIGALENPTLTLGNILSGLILLVGCGSLMIMLSNKSKKNAEKYKKYTYLVIYQKITSIDNIASNIPTTYEMAKRDLQSMIDKGYFEDAYINEGTREIMLLSVHLTNAEMDKGTKEYIVVNCSSCGANNKVIRGSVGECEFCGSPIDGN